MTFNFFFKQNYLKSLLSSLNSIISTKVAILWSVFTNLDFYRHRPRIRKKDLSQPYTVNRHITKIPKNNLRKGGKISKLRPFGQRD